MTGHAGGGTTRIVTVQPAGRPTTSDGERPTSLPATPALLTQVLQLAGQLDAPQALSELITSAATHTGAQYVAIAALDAYGETTVFVQIGMRPDEVALMPHPPLGRGVLGAIPDDGVLLLDDLTLHPDFRGLPPGHPPMYTFLGVPVSVGGVVVGRLYLSEKPGGFTSADVETVQLLAAAAAIAIDNARLYRQARDRERWMSVSQAITTALLEGSDEEDVLALIARNTREVADADAAVIVLPSVDGAWVVEIVDGVGSDEMIGAVLPTDGPAYETVQTGEGLLIDSISRESHRFIPAARKFERALYAPLHAGARDRDSEIDRDLDGEDFTLGRHRLAATSGGPAATIATLPEQEEAEAPGPASVGVLILFRLPGRPPFSEEDLETAQDFGAQAALALRLAAARHAEDVAGMLSERARIARDLHDLAIQQLFAAGMRLEHTKGLTQDTPLGETVAESVDAAIEGIEESIQQIRGIVRSLRDRDEHLPVTERLVREASLARSSLGFAVSMLLSLDGVQMDHIDPGHDSSGEIGARLGERVGDDVVAVVREGLANVARHAQATSAKVEVEVTGQAVRVTVSDDGRGPMLDTGRRSGLANLQSRAEEHGGTARLVPGPQRGSVLTWEAWLG